MPRKRTTEEEQPAKEGEAATPSPLTFTVIYAGQNVYRVGVPARDLSAQEWEALPAEEREYLLTEGLYRITFTAE